MQQCNNYEISFSLEKCNYTKNTLPISLIIAAVNNTANYDEVVNVNVMAHCAQWVWKKM